MKTYDPHNFIPTAKVLFEIGGEGLYDGSFLDGIKENIHLVYTPKIYDAIETIEFSKVSDFTFSARHTGWYKDYRDGGQSDLTFRGTAIVIIEGEVSCVSDESWVIQYTLLAFETDGDDLMAYYEAEAV